jgi:hypothetical protein
MESILNLPPWEICATCIDLLCFFHGQNLLTFKVSNNGQLTGYLRDIFTLHKIQNMIECEN